MPKATWNDAVIAEAPLDQVQVIEGNVYFPPYAVKQEYLQPSEHVTLCHWKGSANYFHVAVNGETNTDAAWTYHAPFEGAAQIANHVAFWRGVIVED